MQELLNTLASQGFSVSPDFSGEYIRFDRNGKLLNGWWCGSKLNTASGIEVLLAKYGDWATGEKYEWRSDEKSTYTAEQQEELLAAQQKDAAAREAKKAAEQEAAAKLAQEILDKGTPGTHAYLQAKGFPERHELIYKQSLVIDIYIQEKLSSLQLIDSAGGKKFLPGGRLKGGYHVIGAAAGQVYNIPRNKINLCEGYATGLSLYYALHEPVVVCFNAANIFQVAQDMPVSPGTEVTIYADNDQWTAGNPGVSWAMKTMHMLHSQGVSCIVKYPMFPANQTGLTDWNDWHCVHGLDKMRLDIEKWQAPAPPIKQAAPAGKYTLPGVKDFAALPISRNKQGNIIPPSQHQVCEELFNTFGDNLLRDGKEVFFWRGTHWEEQEPVSFKFLIKNAALHIRSYLAKNKELDEIYNLFLGQIPGCSPGQMYKNNPCLSNFTDGTLEVRGKQILFRDHSKHDLLTWCLPYEYRAPRPRNEAFRSWLEQCFEGDPDKEGKIKALAQLGGACLNSLYPRIAFLFGPAGTGKSTFAKLCGAFVGEGNRASTQPKHMDQGTFLMERLINKQVNIVTDISQAKIDEALFKQIEDRVPFQINRKGRAVVDAYIPAVHIFCGNKLPSGIDSETSAMDRRVTIVEFNKEVPGIKAGVYTRDYEQELLKAGVGDILEFFEQGLRDLIANNGVYTNPESGQRKLKSWKLRESNTAMFLEAIEAGEIGENGAKLYLLPGARIHRSVVTDAYCRWLGHVPAPKAINAMLHDLDARGYTLAKIGGERLVHGIWVTGRGPKGREGDGTKDLGQVEAGEGTLNTEPAPRLSM